MRLLKVYEGRVPVCGVFCGGCPTYTRETKPCAGATANAARCATCSFTRCAAERGIAFCGECQAYPCGRFRHFSRRWERFGQDLTANQQQLAAVGEPAFLAYYNARARRQAERLAATERPVIKPKPTACAGCPHCALGGEV